jgi:serine phosphatase RsbU (regulator of sigma subunit)
MIKWFTYLFFLIFFSNVSFTQNDYPYGKIDIHYFDPNEYKGESQNWDVTQTSDGLIVVANNKSVIRYDGTNWSIIELDNKDEVRSLKTVNGTTYIGGNSEFGKIYYDSIGTFSYQKLSDSTAKNHYHNVIKAFNTINFVSKEQIYTLQSDESYKITKIPEGYPIQNSMPFNNSIIIDPKVDSVNQKRCILFDGEKFHPINNSQLFTPRTSFSLNNKHYLISFIGEIKELTFVNDSYNLIHTDLYENLQINGKGLDIYSIAIRNNIIAVGTDGSGIYLFDLYGKFIRHINSNDGLSNLQIRKLYFDNSNNLWSANDEGIYLINLSNPIVSFDSNYGITSSVEDFKFEEDKTLLLTHDDLFESSILNTKKIFTNTDLFNLDLYRVEDFIFSDGSLHTIFITNNGIELMSNKKRTLINDMYAWDFIQSEKNPNIIWYGLTNGIGYTIYHPENETFSTHYLKNTSGEVRKLAILNNDVYYSVKYKGIVKLDSAKTQEDNLITQGLTDFNEDYVDYTLCEFNNTIFAGSNHGLYTIKNGKYEAINTELTKKNLFFFRLYNDQGKRLWIITFQEIEDKKEIRSVGYLEFEGDKIIHTTKPFKTLKEDIIQVIKEDLDGNLWFGGKKKAYIYNENINLNVENKINTIISSITTGDSTISEHLSHSKLKTTTLNYENNTIQFTFSTPSYYGENSNTYSYFLEGADEKWSVWSSKTEASFQRLSEGTYTFHVKSKNFYDSENKETTYTFIILPPLYKTIWAYLVYFILGVLLIYGIIKLSLKRVKDQNENLEKIVKERTAEVELQKNEIEHKNRDIVDSIIYAKRIQNTILPTRENTDNILDQHFVIYKPKDIVSGDFFWIEELDGKAYFSAIDCTGHGVPGAFVSIVGFNGIKRTINEFKERQPSKILDRLTDIVIETFTASESHLKDGMDMTLCSLDYSTLKLEFSGANNPLIIIRDGELIEIKGNKQPIGDFSHRNPFTNHEIQLQKEDSIFVFTDGFADQFGGPKGKKLKLKTLKSLLIEISILPIKEQKIELEKAFHDWMGDLEQLDDVCLIGLKI